jgi:hypothetical protein
VDVRNFQGGSVNYWVDGYLYRSATETSIAISNLSNGEHVVRAELAAGDGKAVSPPVVDEVRVTTTVDPPKARQDPILYLVALGGGAAMLALTIAMAAHGIPKARRMIAEMTEQEEQEMTGRRPVRGVR